MLKRDKEMEGNIKTKIEEFLAKGYHCSLDDLNAGGTVFTVDPLVSQPYIKIMTYRNSLVVCTSQSISTKVKKILQGKNRDEIFEMPFVYGQTIHYVPDRDHKDMVNKAVRCELQILLDENVLSLQSLKGFPNSLEFDENGETPTRAVCIARDHKKIIGVAGASASTVSDLWEIGVDVSPGYRNAGIGTCLVQNLTKELLERDIIPFYSASVTNIGSQLAALRSGYVPAWVDTYGTILDGSSVYQDILSGLAVGFLEK